MKTEKQFKISFKSERYFVNEVKRTVVCKLEYQICIPCITGWIFNVESPVYTAVGKAKCAECDVFDIALGKKIARTRAENKAYDIMYAMLDEVMYELTEAYSKLSSKAYHVIEHNKQYINKLEDKCVCKEKPNLAHEDFKEKLKNTTFTLDSSLYPSNNHIRRHSTGVKYEIKDGKAVRRPLTEEERTDLRKRVAKMKSDYQTLINSVFLE